MGKVDEIRAMRERNFEARQATLKPVTKKAKLAKAKSAAKSHVTDKPVTDNGAVSNVCIICNEPFEAKRKDATLCSAACRMRKRRAAPR